MAAKWGFCPWCAVSWARWYSWIWIFVPIVIRFVTICFIWHMIGELSAMCGMPFMALWPQQVWDFLLCPVIGLGIAFPCRCWRRTLYEALRCPRSWCFNSTGSMVPRYGSENFLGFYIEKYLMVLHKVQVILAQDSGRDLLLDAMIWSTKKSSEFGLLGGLAPLTGAIHNELKYYNTLPMAIG